ncbi:hypothetical protein LTR27_000782 [Elasticomyces elasticus]|nr:hypothetical protein LTR27_000782 [Elasticomyces elasticus]
MGYVLSTIARINVPYTAALIIFAPLLGRCIDGPLPPMAGITRHRTEDGTKIMSIHVHEEEWRECLIEHLHLMVWGLLALVIRVVLDPWIDPWIGGYVHWVATTVLGLWALYDLYDRDAGSGADPKRRSLQRLSSIASFQALNPFNRRRSNNTTSDSTINSSSSTLTLSSTAANAPQPQHLQSSSSQLFSIEDEITALPIPPVPASVQNNKRSSYICIPDDPIGGMPRSRTFSNLPLPTRARKNSALSMAPSRSHARLPSAFLSSSRVPSPAASSRKHSTSKLPSFTELLKAQQAPQIRNRMRRSDTEPLLPLSADQVSNMGRSTAFKENISLSPVRPLPVYEDQEYYGSSPPASYANKHGWMDTGKGSEPLLQFDACNENFNASHPYPHHTANFSYSSPAYRRPSTPAAGRIAPPQPVQRWNSQPVLSNITNTTTQRRNSRHGIIPERRLLSAVQPDPPAPPPKTPLTAEALTSGKVTALNKSSTQLPLLTEPQKHSPSWTNLSAKVRAPSPARPTGHITKAQPVVYWCARFSALNDRYRNDELLLHLGASKTVSDKMHSAEANTRRMRRALEHLHSLCATEEARESFVVFQLQFAACQGLPELGRPLMEGKKIMLGSVGNEVGGSEGGEGPGGVAEKRKGTFMGRLLGKGRRSLTGSTIG